MDKYNLKTVMGISCIGEMSRRLSCNMHGIRHEIEVSFGSKIQLLNFNCKNNAIILLMIWNAIILLMSVIVICCEDMNKARTSAITSDENL